jgi:site-specific recombinase XerD
MSRRRRLPNFLRAAEIDRLIQAAEACHAEARSPAKKAAARRDLVQVQAGLFLGLRVSELCKLRVEDLDLDQRTAMVVQGKGGKDRSLPISERLFAVLMDWLGERRAGFVFEGKGGRKLSTRTVQLRMLALGQKAGLTKRLKPHTLRHSFATRLLEKQAAIHEVSELMGHSNISTTQVYLHTVPERLRGAVDRL